MPEDKQIISSEADYLDLNIVQVFQKIIFLPHNSILKKGKEGLKIYKNFINLI